MINGNEEAVRRTLQNLIRNALVHGQSQISLSLFCRGDQAGFRCSNDTEHPDEIDINQIFSRFYKADAARTHTSAGLGLSIAKGLTERMGGSISAALEDNLFTVEILFPLKYPPSFLFRRREKRPGTSFLSAFLTYFLWVYFVCCFTSTDL